MEGLWGKNRYDDPILEKACWAQALCFAAGGNQLEIVQYFVQFGVGLDTNDYQFATPLSAAASKGHLDMIRYILAHGGNVNRISDDSSNHFYGATEEGQGAAVKLMLEHLDPAFLASNDEDERELLLYFAVASNSQIHVEKFVQSSGPQHRGIMVQDPHTSYPRFHGPLDFAVRVADDRIATILLNELARCETQDLRTYLHGPLCLAICEGKEHMINLLLDHGADPNYPGPGGGRLPLMLAIKNEYIFRLLLERGADPRARFDKYPSDASVLKEVIRTGPVTLVQELLDRAVPIDRDNLIWDVLKGGD